MGLLIVGLTGRSGSGKGEVSSLFCSLGCKIIDADKIYHGLLIPPSDCLDEIVNEFGNAVIHTDGSLDRKALSGIVFSDHEKLERLNSIAHRHVLKKIKCIISELENSFSGVVIVDAPQLFESGFDAFCDKVVSVVSSDNALIERIVKRDGIDKERAALRLSSQLGNDYFLSHSDLVIYNDSSLDELYEKAKNVFTVLGEEYDKKQ